ncbi:transglutaminase/protease-like domain protein [Geotalea daltonii FRC-32]|uniref:Transglutaminase/protease-like domain protein n=1 Tax=Geotalea daltonii (strain DSM 22248 / JCM 15807 / FRC-32) TaxID=316067 RepID=B9M5Q0_GEODF|nr:transglutaminase-like domain-containing protein [Geotalea daltonii]ACM21809.1 transglutaminase/protease-like domain protein [Geotalea daltonii FRC-32]
MFRKYSRQISAVVLCFFTWTSGGVFSIANAAQIEAKKAKLQQVEKKPEGSEERFAKATEEVEDILGDKKEDLQTKKGRLRTKKAEIEALDVEVRKQFAETEKKLKDAKLPPEILERHRKFVKHYDDNLAELKGNLDIIEKAKDKAEADTGMEKAHQHLEKTKAPSRHQKLDPNNLPHRQPKVIKREPRMKKEEFEKDLKKDKHAWKNQMRIMLASAGSTAGLLTPDDLAETIEVQLTPEIRAKALELGNNPVKIYEWVRNNIEFVPTWGSIQGAQMTMQTKQGNAFDTSSLLIALLRTAGIHARYVTGTVELPIEKIMNWAGGFSDPMAALDFMSSGGIPTKGLVANGKIVAARFEHVWVEAFIDYIPSRGAKHKQGQGDTWIRLDPSYKQYNYSQGIDIKTAVPFDAQSFLTQIQSGATINETQGYVTGVNSLLVQQTMQDYQTRVQNYIQQNYPNATVGDVLGKKEIVKKEYPYLLGTLPYRTAVKGATFAAVPDTLRHKLSFYVKKETVDITAYDPDAPLPTDTSLNISKNLAELAGKKITLSYSPATPQDEAVINSFLPTPHADGSPIQPSELPSQLPAYLINVKPELRIDGQVVATGAPVGLGGTNIFTITFSDPSYGASQITNYIDAGVYQAIGLNLGRISQEQLTALKSKLETTKTKLQNSDFSGMMKDDLVGDLLYTTALAYHAELGTMNYITARTMNVNAITVPSETIFATKLRVAMFFGIPRFVSTGGLNMDADYLMQVVKAKDGNNDTAKQYMLSSGMTSSALEHSVPEQLFSTPENQAQAISTVKALKIANDQGIPIYTINQQNVSALMPQLQLDQQTKEDISNAVNAGKVVTVSKTNINFNGWVGCGYIITNPETCAGAYMINGAMNGGLLQRAMVAELMHYLAIAAAAGDSGLEMYSVLYSSGELQKGFYCVLVGISKYEANKIVVDKLDTLWVRVSTEFLKKLSFALLGMQMKDYTTSKDLNNFVETIVNVIEELV